jgi:hypothetical protein
MHTTLPSTWGSLLCARLQPFWAYTAHTDVQLAFAHKLRPTISCFGYNHPWALILWHRQLDWRFVQHQCCTLRRGNNNMHRTLTQHAASRQQLRTHGVITQA